MDGDLTQAEKDMIGVELIEYLIPHYPKLTSFLDKTWLVMLALVPMLKKRDVAKSTVFQKLTKEHLRGGYALLHMMNCCVKKAFKNLSTLT